MSDINMYVKCLTCDGSGKIMTHEEIPTEMDCPTCNGLGKALRSTIDTTDIMNELDWIKKKIKKILQKLDIPEEE